MSNILSKFFNSTEISRITKINKTRLWVFSMGARHRLSVDEIQAIIQVIELESAQQIRNLNQIIDEKKLTESVS